MKNLGMVLLSIWLIVTGLLTFVTVSIPSSGIVLALLAIAAGVLFLLDMREKRLSGNISGRELRDLLPNFKAASNRIGTEQ